MNTHDHVSASFGDRKPPYSNWHYSHIVYETFGGFTRTAAHASALTTAEQMLERAGSRIGSVIGFGIHEGEVVIGFEVVTARYDPHPDGIEVTVKPDASSILTRCLSSGRSPQAGFTREEFQSIKWLRDNGGRRFQLADSTPQMSTEQFHNTLPTDDAPSGFFLPRGLCSIA